MISMGQIRKIVGSMMYGLMFRPRVVEMLLLEDHFHRPKTGLVFLSMIAMAWVQMLLYVQLQLARGGGRQDLVLGRSITSLNYDDCTFNKIRSKTAKMVHFGAWSCMLHAWCIIVQCEMVRR